MKISRLIAVGAATVLAFGAALTAQAQQEESTATFEVAQAALGSKELDFVLLCEGPAFVQEDEENFGGFVLTVDGEVVASGELTPAGDDEGNHIGGYAATTDEQKLDLGARTGETVITATCIDYQGGDASAQDSVTLNTLFIEPDSWVAGDTITIGGYGLEAGDNVTLTMVKVEDGQNYWTTEGGAVAGDGWYERELVLKSDVPEGRYTLTAADESGNQLSAQFFWGQDDQDDDGDDDDDADDDDDNDDDDNGNNNGKPGTKNPGLPKAGV